MIKLEFRELDVSPGKTEAKQGECFEFISHVTGYFRDTDKSKNINFIFSNPLVHIGYYTDRSKLKAFQLVFSG